jgi:hypothetical protein
MLEQVKKRIVGISSEVNELRKLARDPQLLLTLAYHLLDLLPRGSLHLVPHLCRVPKEVVH